MTETITITNQTIVADLDGPSMSEAERERLGKIIAARIERDLWRALLGGWPEGYDPGKGFPGTYYLERPPCCCHGVILHEPNCKYSNCIT